MVRNLRRIGTGMILASLPVTIISIVLGIYSHIASRDYEREIHRIIAKTSAELTEQDERALEECQYHLENCETGLGIGSYGGVASAGIVALGWGLYGIDGHKASRRRKEN